MNEAAFITENKEKWIELEELLDARIRDPDKLQELFIKVSSDLSYARTFYPNRTIRLYLNQLTQRVLGLIHTRRNTFSWSTVSHFYRHTLPQQLWRARYALLMSFLIFSIAVSIGALSTAYNSEFTEVILGEAYVEMTNKNINEGDPMAVYKKMGQVDMFFGISLNNIRVAFFAFIMGLFGTVGTVVILLSNGIMLGSFQYFFFQKGLFLTSFLTIWIHGTIEISAIIIAGAAGIILGDGLLHPKTYNRTISLQVASKRAIRVLLCTVPLFLFAGFLESFITRLTDMPVLLKAAIIILSLIFVIYHIVIYPYQYQKNNSLAEDDYDAQTSDLSYTPLKINRYLSFGQITEYTFAQIRKYLGKIFYHGITPVLVLNLTGYWIWAHYTTIAAQGEQVEFGSSLLFNYEHGLLGLFFIYWISIIHLTIVIALIYEKGVMNFQDYQIFVSKSGWQIALITLPYLMSFYFFPIWVFIIVLLSYPPQCIFSFIHRTTKEENTFLANLYMSTIHGHEQYQHYIGPFIMVSFIYFLIWLILITLSNTLYSDFLSWYNFFPGNINNAIFIQSLFRIIAGAAALTFYFFLFSNQYQALEFKQNSKDLYYRIARFGEHITNR